MKFAAAVAVFCGLALGAKHRGRDPDVHPVVNVIELLKELKGDVISQGQTEELSYTKFEKWCTDNIKLLNRAVESGKENIDSLEDEVKAKTQENKTLTDQIEKLGDEIAKIATSESAASNRSTERNNLYTAADGDYGTTITAFENAITELENAKTTTSAAAALIQEIKASLPAIAAGSLSDRQVGLLEFATMKFKEEPDPEEERPDLLSKGDYNNHTKKYKFKSDNIVELLKELKASFEDQRVEATKAETNAANEYELAKGARENAKSAAEGAKEEKETTIGNVQEALNTATGDLGDARGDLSADEGTLETTKRQCSMKKSEWEERSSIRAGEVKALEAGIKILGKVTGVSTEKPENPMPPIPPSPPENEEGASGSDFLQKTVFIQSDPKTRAVNLLKTEAARLHSKSFKRFAQELATKVTGPFDEVNNMIQKMIFRLMAEQKDEDDHKNWCDLELNKTNASIEHKEDKLEELELKIQAADGTVGDLVQEIEDAAQMVADINSFIEEATNIRNAGKKENKKAIEDAKKAQEAIAKATAVIEEFYKDTGMVAKEAWEFVQEPVTLPENPSTWDSSYTGVADPKEQPGGIITMLETIGSEFSQMEAETKAQEATDEKNYQDEIKTQTIEKARRSKEEEMKQQEKQRLSDKIVAMKRSEKHTKSEKEANEQYLKDLEPACVEGDSTYEDRKQARVDEIDALKEAQVILADAFNDNSTNSSDAPSDFLQVGHGSPAFLAPVRRA